MKLFEIIQRPLSYPAGASRTLKRKIDNMHRRDPNNKFVGAGWNAYVHSKEGDPQSSDRVYRTSARDDGTVRWLRYVSKNPELANNPFVPKVFARESSKRDNPTYQIERLIPFDHLPFVSIPFDSEAYDEEDPSYDPQTKIALALLGDYLVNDFDIYAYYNFDTMLTGIMHHALWSGDTSQIANPQLKQALNAIINITKKFPQLGSDIHSHNIMWRKTNDRLPQLVITDPLASKI